MGFFGGYEWERNPGLDPALGGLQAAMDDVGNTKSAGNRFARNILKGLMKGDTSAIGNPFLAQLGGQNRLVDANMDPFLPPEIASARAGLQKNRNQEQAGVNFEGYVRGMAGDAMQANIQNNQWKASEKARLAQAMAEAQLGGHQGHQTQGWGSVLMSGLGAAGGIMSGLGGMGVKF